MLGSNTRNILSTAFFLVAAASCGGGDDEPDATDGAGAGGAGTSGAAGTGGSTAGSAGKGGSGTAGKGGSGTGGSTAGASGSGTAGKGGSGTAGKGGSAGSSAGTGGTGTAGTGGSGGDAGTTQAGGAGGAAGSEVGGSGGDAGTGQGGSAGSGTAGTSAGGSAGTGAAGGPVWADGPPAGNPDGTCAVPAEAQAEDTSNPTNVVGNGTKESCTSDAVVAAVAKGGIITFSCGPDPITIVMEKTAKIFNDKGPKIVIDGGGKVTLSGGKKVRILYQNTCDQAQVWTTSHCQNQDHPQLTIQNLTFVDGNSTGETAEGGGGGAVFVRGGRLKIVNSRFFGNACDPTGPDLGGASVRSLSQFDGQPVYVVNSTFGGKPGYGNACSNGGGLSSIGVSHTVINSLFSDNEAIGNGANPAKPGTPGGGSGGAIYNDGNTFTLSLCGVKMTNNKANEGGGAIFFVSNDKTGTLVIKDSFLSGNPSGKFQTQPGIFFLGSGNPQVSGSTIQ